MIVEIILKASRFLSQLIVFVSGDSYPLNLLFHCQWHLQLNQKSDPTASIHTLLCCRMLASDLISV